MHLCKPQSYVIGLRSTIVKMKCVFVYSVISALILLFFSGTTSPLHNLPFTDGLVFQYVALGIQHGLIPYIDIFDHKGPLTYFINYLGLLIGGRYGILLLQWINLCLTFFVCERICTMLHFKRYLSISLPIASLCLIQMIDEGGMTEEWSLLFLSIPMLFFVPTLTTDRLQVPYWQMIVTGLCAGLIALLRLNNTAPLFGIFVFWFVLVIRTKDYRYLLSACSVCLFSFLLPVAIACLWFYARAGVTGLYEFYYANIGFNLEYAQKPWPHTIPLWKLIPAQFFYLFVIVVTLIRCSLISRKYRMLILGVLSSFIVTLATMGRAFFPHYHLILIPMILLSVSLMSFYRQRLPIFLLAISGLFCLKYTIGATKKNLQERESVTAYQQNFTTALQVIPMEERSDTWNLNVLGNIDLFIQNELFPIDRFCLTWHRNYTQRFMEEEKDTFRQKTPKWVFVEEEALDEYTNVSDIGCLRTNYHRVSSTGSAFPKTIAIYRYNQSN